MLYLPQFTDEDREFLYPIWYVNGVEPAPPETVHPRLEAVLTIVVWIWALILASAILYGVWLGISGSLCAAG